MEEKSANLVVAVCEMDHSPLWANTLPEDNSMINFIKHEVVEMPRKSIPAFQRINGAIYLVNVAYLMESKNLYFEKSFATIMDKENSVDIDDKMNSKIIELLITNRLRRV